MTAPRLRDTRDGSIMLAAEGVQSAAGGVAGVAIPWLVLEHGGGPGSAAVIFAATIGPYALIGIPAAMAADHASRRTMLVASYALQALALAVIPIAAVLDAVTTPLLVAVALAVGCARVVGDAAIFGAVPTLVGRDGIVRATGALTTTWSAGFLAGPAFGGAVIAAVGPTPTLAAVACCYAISIALARQLSEAVEARPDATASPLERVQHGLRFLLRDRVMRRFTAVGLLWNLLVGAFGGLAVAFVHGPLALTAGAAGLTLACYGAAGLLVPFALPRLDRHFGDGPLFVLLCTVSAAVLFALAHTRVPVVAALLLLPLGFLNMTLGSILPAARQRRAPMDLQSLVGTTGRMLNIWGYAGGALAAGRLADLRGIPSTFTLCAVLLVVVAAVARLLVWRLAPPAAGASDRS